MGDALIFGRQCRSRSDCTGVQSDLDVHCSIWRYFSLKNNSFEIALLFFFFFVLAASRPLTPVLLNKSNETFKPTICLKVSFDLLRRTEVKGPVVAKYKHFSVTCVLI